MPTNDDLRNLLNAVHDSAPVPPVAVVNVQRRVRRARRQRRAGIGVAAVAATVVAALAAINGPAALPWEEETSRTIASEPAPAPEPRLLVWDDAHGTVDLGEATDVLPAAPEAFKEFIRGHLRDVWQNELEGLPACRLAPRIDVDALRTDGFAAGSVSQQSLPGCASGGAYTAIWAVQQGTWREIVATQDVIGCADLEALAVPSEIGVYECFDGADIVTYTHP